VHGGRDIAKGTLRGILNDIGMTIDQPAPWGWSHAAAAGSPGTAWFAQCFVRLYEHAGQLMGGADRAEPEPHSHCSGANRDATGRTPTRPLAPLSLRHPPQRRLTDSIREQNRRCVP
jgi:hypothetical protein